MMLPGSVPRVLLVGSAHGRADSFRNLLQKKGFSASCLNPDAMPAQDVLRGADVVVCALDPQGGEADLNRLRDLLALPQAENMPLLLWGVPDNFDKPDNSLTDCLSADVGLDELMGRLTALARYAPVVQRLEDELQRLQRLGRHLNHYFDEVDQEMRLAGRVQRDFLPRSMPSVAPLRFAQLYRPAGWVSGDIFDVFAIDEQHVGVFIADAMGHGTASGLMTMFLRRALEPTQRENGRERIASPVRVLEQVHKELARQEFPNAQFATAAYAIIDVPVLDMRFARGGHPYPLHINAAGEIHEIRCDGGLLGIPGFDPDFEEHRSTLAPGDKVIFYTDGLEELFIARRDPYSKFVEFTQTLRDWAPLDADGLVSTINTHLDQQEGSLNPADDVTLVVAEVER